VPVAFTEHASSAQSMVDGYVEHTAEDTHE
jgi:hypothetical protein